MAPDVEGSDRSQIHAFTSSLDWPSRISECLSRGNWGAGAVRLNIDSAEAVLRQAKSGRQKFIPHFGQNRWRQARSAARRSALEGIRASLHSCVLQQESPLVWNEFGTVWPLNVQEIRRCWSQLNFDQKCDPDSWWRAKTVPGSNTLTPLFDIYQW